MAITKPINPSKLKNQKYVFWTYVNLQALWTPEEQWLVEQYSHGTMQSLWEFVGEHHPDGKSKHGGFPDNNGDVAWCFQRDMLSLDNERDAPVRILIKSGTKTQEVMRLIKNLTQFVDEKYDEDGWVDPSDSEDIA